MDDEPIYIPFKTRKPRKKAAESGDSAVVVEYDRGYLREQQKLARGVYIQKRQAKLEKKRAEYSRPLLAIDDSGSIELIYVLELGAERVICENAMQLQIWWRPKNIEAGASRVRLQPYILDKGSTVPSAVDKRIVSFLLPYHCTKSGTRGNEFFIPSKNLRGLFSVLWEGNQLRWGARDTSGVWRLHPLRIPSADRPTPWSVYMPQTGRNTYALQVILHTLSGEFSMEKFTALGKGGWIIANNELHCIEIASAWEKLSNWCKASWAHQKPSLTYSEALAASQCLSVDGGAILDALPEQLRCEAEMLKPSGRLYITTARYKYHDQEQLQADLDFDYAGTTVSDVSTDTRERIPGCGARVILRDREHEEKLRQELKSLGFRFVSRNTTEEEPGWKLAPARLESAVLSLVSTGWEVTAEGKNYRKPVTKNMTVSAFGIDWLEIEVQMDFGDGKSLQTPQILQAFKSGCRCVLLDDGTYGILPSEWLQHFTALTEIGECTDGRIRLRQQQAALLEALLQERLEDTDGIYTRRLEEMSAATQNISNGVFSLPENFHATLRNYQSTGAQWMEQLSRSNLGGILADDMGLGKTIQVIALLSRYYTGMSGASDADRALPSLIVVPSSLLFNWQNEILRFAPFLSISQYHGIQRNLGACRKSNLVLTTYGTMRVDAVKLARDSFAYIILDEAQAIKNYESGTAKAARVLKGIHRIAMTGTPVENHLAELFSQLSFLNPGIFTAKVAAMLGTEHQLLHDHGVAHRLQSAVGPFILRRRKEQVAPELPPKTEQILFCDMEEQQAAQYTELSDFYRAQLAEAEKNGGGSAMNILGALLRLRQAACHCGLINDSARDIPSAKLQLLKEQIGSLVSSGHKVLVFSQFTSMLKLIGAALSAQAIRYCYLDGTVQNRGELVQQFQEDESIGAFLISLKAGGVGLNLTAADYVFIVDPWWNPAAEAQAIDRAYRIGQSRPVIAYRLITRGTVEEKVLQMQNMKQRIANVALAAGNTSIDGIPQGISLADLRRLL